ncbi:MAG TPA: lysylphosphatidylglycerol synthase domain-containing protein [Gemmatimonadales bacterium]|nr:lysylphosphatidylglycerol synthase domain-containing protein [Gemmatimonadales bacterium]
MATRTPTAERPTARSRPLLRALGWIVELALLAGALWIVRRQLREVSIHELIGEFRSLRPNRLVASFALTVLGYLALAGYDIIALRFLRRSLAISRIVLASFIGYALANNIPLSLFVGGSVRYRFYSRWGLTTAETTELVFLNLVTYTVGLLTAAALAFLLEPAAVPRLIGLRVSSTQPLGFVALAGVLAYLAWSLWGKPFHVMRWRLEPPSPSFAVQQIVVSLADWTLSGAALFVLLPGSQAVAFFGFFEVFILGQIAALIAQLPGGIGIFEAVVLAMLGGSYRRGAIFSALVAYRVIYFFLPLCVATALLSGRAVLKLGE